MTDIRDLLPLYAAGALEPEEAALVEQAIGDDPKLAAELETYTELLVTSTLPVAPPADIKARLLASVGGGRFERFSARIAEVFDVTVDRARELLGLVERAASWEHPLPGIGLIHFNGGPACATADCGFVQIAPGCTFPWHTHRGEEVSVIIAGTIRDADGRVLKAGDELVHTVGSQHDVVAEADGAIFVARAFDGIELGQRP